MKRQLAKYESRIQLCILMKKKFVHWYIFIWHSSGHLISFRINDWKGRQSSSFVVYGLWRYIGCCCRHIFPMTINASHLLSCVWFISCWKYYDSEIFQRLWFNTRETCIMWTIYSHLIITHECNLKNQFVKKDGKW